MVRRSKRVRRSTLRHIRPGRASHRSTGRRFGIRATVGVYRSGKNAAPWFLKAFGSRPEHKRAPALAEVA